MVKRLLLSFFLSVFCVVMAFAQDRVVSGQVTDPETGEGIPGVTVLVKNTTQGTVTDASGNYQISVPEGGILVFQAVGLETQEVTVGAQSTINLEMGSAVQGLNEVVVVGYGEQSDKTLVQSISRVNSESFENFPLVSVQEVLQGQAAGVQMTATSGVVGSSSAIRIRGVSSITSGTSPLFVVDGVPLNDGDYSNALGATPLNPLADLNPQDIASISILKDAAAVSIYGSRGANGVILITTKRGGLNEKTVFSFDYYTGWSKPTTTPDMMDADQFRQFRADVFTIQGTPTDPNDADVFPQTSFDWPSAVEQTGRVSSYSLSARGGTAKTSFYVGLTYFNKEGYIIGNELDRVNLTSNINHEASDKLRFGLSLKLSNSKYDRVNSDNSTFAPFTSAFLQLPWVEAFNDDGTFTQTGFIRNVVAREQTSQSYFVSRRVIGNFYLEVEPIQGLVLRTDNGLDVVQTEERERDLEVFEPGGYAYEENNQDIKWLSTNTIAYRRTFGDHSINVLTGFSFETADRNDIAVEGVGFATDALPNVASAATPTTTFASGTRWALDSQFGRVNYNYKEKYIIEGTVRRDGSSRFGPDRRYGTFWSVAGGWNISDEAFMENIAFLDFLKLRVSYGTTGNDRIGNFTWQGLYGGGNDYNGLPGFEPSNPANLNLSWEETEQFDVTISAGLLKNRISFDISYYNKNTTNLLLDRDLEWNETGFADIQSNLGELRNQGIDFNINTVNLDVAGFKWTTNLNLGYLDNEVTSLPGVAEDNEGRPFVTGSANQRAIVNYPVNTYFLIPYIGVNSQTGEAEWLGINGEPTSNPTQDDRRILGQALPKWNGGFTNTFTYKGITLTAFFTFQAGGKLYDDGLRFTDNAATGSFNKRVAVLDIWRNPGDAAFVPSPAAASFADWDQRSGLHLYSNSFLRLRNLRIAYDFPKSLMQKTKYINSFTVYAMGTNIATFFNSFYKDVGWDPESTEDGDLTGSQSELFFTPPQEKAFTVGVRMGF